MVWLGVLLTLAAIVLWVYAFIDALTTPAPEVRILPKVVWLVVILLLPLVGALLWLVFGRPRLAAPQGRERTPTPQTPDLAPTDFSQRGSGDRPIGPDDDPDFLRDINKRINPEE